MHWDRTASFIRNEMMVRPGVTLDIDHNHLFAIFRTLGIHRHDAVVIWMRMDGR